MLFKIKIYCFQCSLFCCVQITLKNDSLSHLFLGKDWEKEFPHIFVWRQLVWKDLPNSNTCYYNKNLFLALDP